MNDYTAGKAWKIERKQKIIETGFRLFSDRGIETVTLPEIARESGVGNATLYRYFNTKLDLVLAVSTWTWNDYIDSRNHTMTAEEIEQMTAAQYLRFFMDAFIDLYQNHKDLLRFNYSFNSFLRYEPGSAEQRRPFADMVENLEKMFHVLYERGRADGTLNTEYSETMMFSSTFHIMLAAVTRYAVGLAYVPQGDEPDNELFMLEELLLSRFIK